MAVFGKKIGDVCGLPYWLSHQVVRYGAPVAGMGWALGSVEIGVIAAAVSTIAYWPIGHSLTDGERAKYVGAAIIGAACFGLLAA